MAYQPSANVVVPKINNSDFIQLKDVFNDWLSYDMELQFKSRSFNPNDSPFADQHNKLIDKVKQLKNKLDVLLKKLKQQGLDTDKMWRDMQMNDRLSSIESYYKK